MKFDINEVVAGMVAAVKDNVKDDWPLVKSTANNYLVARKERLELLASLRLSNEIADDFFQKRLSDEKKILESELHSIAVITKAIAERAANAALDVLQSAIKAAAGTIL